MANPLEGFGNLLNTNQLTNFDPGNFNKGFASLDMNKINSLDSFIDESENPEMLRGAISKIQIGEGLEQKDLAGLSGKERELVNDLKSLQGVAGPGEVVSEFSDLMGKYLNNVDQKHKTAENAVQTFASGGNIDLHSVMIASEKASLSMQLTMQLRNKIVQAYQEINSIRV